MQNRGNIKRQHTPEFKTTVVLELLRENEKRYWGGHLWAIGFGAWSTGNLTQEMIN